jgi:hypothetical protein
MGRYQQYQRDVREKPAGVHPVWRGIGFLLMGLISVMAYAGANLLVEANKSQGWIEVPPEIQGGVSWAPDLYAEIIVGIFLAIIGFSLVTIVYSLIYQATRPEDVLKKK